MDQLEVPWIEKYRPKSLDDVAAHTEIINTIQKLLDSNQLPHLLLYGPPGTGKTSTILAVARQLYGTSMKSMVLDLNASDDRGIDVVRNQIQDFVSTKCFGSSLFKLVVLDECDAMTKDGQMALRRIVEKYARNARFCLICNYVSKIIPALQSRCTRFRFKPLQQQYVYDRCQQICEKEGVQTTEDGLQALVKLGAGDMRRTLNILQAVSLSGKELSCEQVYNSTGKPQPKYIEQIIEAMLNSKYQAAYQKVQKVQAEHGIALVDLVQKALPWVIQASLPPKVKLYILSQLAVIEANLSVGTSESLQLGALVALFNQSRDTIVQQGV